MSDLEQGLCSYRFRSKLNRRQNIRSIQMKTKISLLLLRQYLKNSPTSSPALERRVGKSLSEDGVHDLLPQQELPTPSVLDDVGDGRGGG